MDFTREDEIGARKIKKLKYKVERFLGGNLKGRVKLDLRVRIRPKPPEHVVKGIEEKLAEVMEVRWSKSLNNEYWIGIGYDKIKIDKPWGRRDLNSGHRLPKPGG